MTRGLPLSPRYELQPPQDSRDALTSPDSRCNVATLVGKLSTSDPQSSGQAHKVSVRAFVSKAHADFGGAAVSSQLEKHPTYLTREQAASYLGVSPGTLARWASNGEGPPYYLLGRSAKYLPVQLDAFIDSRRRPIRI